MTPARNLKPDLKGKPTRDGTPGTDNDRDPHGGRPPTSHAREPAKTAQPRPACDRGTSTGFAFVGKSRARNLPEERSLEPSTRSEEPDAAVVEARLVMNQDDLGPRSGLTRPDRLVASLDNHMRDQAPPVVRLPPELRGKPVPRTIVGSSPARESRSNRPSPPPVPAFRQHRVAATPIPRPSKPGEHFRARGLLDPGLVPPTSRSGCSREGRPGCTPGVALSGKSSWGRAPSGSGRRTLASEGWSGSRSRPTRRREILD